MTNIIFLDVDGVLNDLDYVEKCYQKHHQPMSMDYMPFNPRSLTNFRKIYDSILDNDNEPLVVLSSTWRLSKSSTYVLNARLAEYGIYIKETTPSIHQERGKEIIEWLETNNHLNSPFVILDDENFDIICEERLARHLVKTTTQRGLLGIHVNKAIRVLQNEGSLNDAKIKL